MTGQASLHDTLGLGDMRWLSHVLKCLVIVPRHVCSEDTRHTQFFFAKMEPILMVVGVEC